MVTSWLAACLGKHRECGSQTPPPQLPTRVVDVGIDGGPVRLVEPDSSAGPYVCLSHRWPLNGEAFRCLQDNTKTLKDRIPMEELSQNFCEAINFVRRLFI
jgi:hypothetical protein